MKATVSLCGGLRFVGRAGSGHSVLMDGATAHGGSDSAPRPAELLLLGLAGCTGMDVISILRKKRQDVTALEVTVNGDLAGEQPAAFKELEVKYTIRGKGIDSAAVERSIELSEKKYCTVGATLAGAVRITSSYKIEEG